MNAEKQNEWTAPVTRGEERNETAVLPRLIFRHFGASFSALVPSIRRSPLAGNAGRACRSRSRRRVPFPLRVERASSASTTSPRDIQRTTWQSLAGGIRTQTVRQANCSGRLVGRRNLRPSMEDWAVPALGKPPCAGMQSMNVRREGRMDRCAGSLLRFPRVPTSERVCGEQGSACREGWLPRSDH